MAKQQTQQKQEKAKVVNMTPERQKLYDERGYDIVPISVLQGPPPELYPRALVNEDMVELYRENWDSYQNSPIKAELENGFILDGMHRFLACREVALVESKKKGEEELDESKATIRVQWVETPATPADLLIVGAQYNSKHGFALNEDDRKRCVIWLNKNSRPKKGISAWQKDLASKFGVSDRTIREWINTSVEDEKAAQEEQIKELLVKNDAMPDDDKNRLSFEQIAQKVGATRNRVRSVRNNMMKDQRAEAARQAEAASHTTKSDPTDGMKVDVAKGPVQSKFDENGNPIEQPEKVSVLDKAHPIYSENEVEARKAMVALSDDDASMLYDEYCKAVAVLDQNNSVSAKKNLDMNPKSPELREMYRAFEDEAETSWKFVQNLCKARIENGENLNKWANRSAGAYKREHWVDPDEAKGNPHAAQREHVSMQNRPIGEKAIKVGGNDSFSIYRSPIVDDGFCVGPTDTSTPLKMYMQVSGARAREEAEAYLVGFTENPEVYAEFVETIVKRARPEAKEEPDEPPDPSSGSVVGGERQKKAIKTPTDMEGCLRMMDSIIGAYNLQEKTYKRGQLSKLILICINFWTDRDTSLEMGELLEIFTNEITPLIEIEEG